MAEELLYLNLEITRNIIANKLEISDGYLSDLTSQNFNCNFNDYINEFRVNKSIEMFKIKVSKCFLLKPLDMNLALNQKVFSTIHSEKALENPLVNTKKRLFYPNL